MSACAEQAARVYYCPICGPIMRFDLSDEAHVTYHKDKPHGYVIENHDEDTNPQ